MAVTSRREMKVPGGTESSAAESPSPLHCALHYTLYLLRTASKSQIWLVASISCYTSSFLTLKFCWTFASVSPDAIMAGGAIETVVANTVINVGLAVLSSEPCNPTHFLSLQ